MNNEFISALMPYLMDDGEFNFLGLSGINGWPDIDNNDDEETFRAGLDMENCGVVGFTDTTLTMCCGGDWQDPHEVEIVLTNGQLSIVSCIPCNFDDNSDLENQVENFFSGYTHRRKGDIRRDMERAVKNEDYISADRFRDELDKLEPAKYRERTLRNLLEQ